jgi:hypothetical protein
MLRSASDHGQLSRFTGDETNGQLIPPLIIIIVRYRWGGPRTGT